ncbi:MAG: hypothetical protein AB1428_08520 [Bacteroidota bacterium]
MGEMLQYVGSLFSGGVIFLMLITFFAGIGETAVTQTFSTTVQENFVSATENIERDFRGIGYGVTDSIGVLLADSSRLIYRTDLGDDGVIDTIMYELGPLLSWGGGNPRARILYRSVNGAPPIPVATGVTEFTLQYFDSAGTPALADKDVRALHVAMTLESDTHIEGGYPGVYWHRTVKPKNLR